MALPRLPPVKLDGPAVQPVSIEPYVFTEWHLRRAGIKMARSN
jgi:hypothetical protein